MAAPVLKVDGLTVAYGGIQAVKGVSLEVHEGELITLIGLPRLLLLDEPSMGLSPIMVELIFEVVRNVAAQGVTILLVEQNARLALQAAHRGYVMESGLITMSGPAQAMLDDPNVRQA